MNIVFVGINGALLNNRACDIRLFFCASILAKKNNVIILNKYPAGQCKDYSDLKNVSFENVVKKNKPGLLSRFGAHCLEPLKIFQLNKKSHIDILHIYSEHFVEIYIYSILARIIKAKTIFQYVEYRSAFTTKNIFKCLDYYIYDHIAAKLCNGVIPISEFLKDRAVENNSNIKTLKIVPLCDFSLYNANSYNPCIDGEYVLYCGSLAYSDVIKTICKSFYKSEFSNRYKLLLVLSGSNQQMNDIAFEFPKVLIRTHLPYDELIGYYKNSQCLLIPLRPIVSDIARFPNKIAEYLASKKPIITTNIGDIPYYFKDGINAIIAENYSEESLSKIFNRIANGEYNMQRIAQKGYETGIDFFNCSSYEDKFQEFINHL